LKKQEKKLQWHCGAKQNEIYFTGCGSESDNIAIKGMALANRNKGNHIITTKIEHPAVLNTCKTLEKDGFNITYLNVDEKGVSFTLSNVGDVDGKEVCQVYVSKPESKVFRAVKELKGFKKVCLKAGESVKVSIPFDEYTFRVFDVDKNKFVVEDGEYKISVGRCSTDNGLSKNVLISGEKLCPKMGDGEIPNYYLGTVKDVPASEFEKLLGYPLPDGQLKFVKRKRIIVDYNTAIVHLRYAKGFVGRLFSWGIRTAYKVLKGTGKRKTANVILMGPYYMPVRGLSRMTGGMITAKQLDCLIEMFNGKFFKGLKGYIKAGKEAKKLKKQNKTK